MKKILIYLISSVIILSCFSSCAMVNKYIRKEPAQEAKLEDTTPITEENAEEELTEAEETTPQAEEAKPVILSNYFGNWHPTNETENVELRILSTDSNYVEFSLWSVYGGSIENVNARVIDNTASFDMFESNDTISGKLIFTESAIILSLDEANVSYPVCGETTFDGRHSDSYQEKYEFETKEPEVYVPEGIVAPAYSVPTDIRYVNTPNDILYLRKGPDKTFEHLFKLPDRTELELCGYNDSGEWAYVYFPAQGIYGWCSNEYLTF